MGDLSAAADGGGGGHDVAVIGGGVLGQSAALECVRAGLRVVLIYPCGHGPDSATLAAGAMIGAFGELDTGFDEVDRQRLEFRLRGQDMHREWLAGLRAESGQEIYSTSGIFMIANNGDGDRERLAHIKIQLDAYNRRNSWVSPQDVPLLQPQRDHHAQAALFIDDDLTVDAANLLDALTLALRHSGRCTEIDDRVTDLLHHETAGEWTARTRHRGSFTVPHIIVCAGARVPAVLGEAVLRTLRLPTLYFAKGMGAVVSGATPFPHAIRTPNRSAACGLHVVPRNNKQLYIGASNHYGYATAAARGVTPGEITAILGGASREINATLRDTTIERVRMGLRPVSADDAPIVGRTRLPGLHVATGTFRTGIVMAPLIGQVVKDELLGNSDGARNPFSATDDRISRPSGRADGDLNVAILYADQGLRHYNRSRLTGAAKHRRRAAADWRWYVELAGDQADRRIVALLDGLQSAGKSGDVVW